VSISTVDTFVLFVCCDVNVNGQTDVTGISIVLYIWQVQSSQLGPTTTYLDSGVCGFS